VAWTRRKRRLCVLGMTSHRNNKAAPHNAKSTHLSIGFKTAPNEIAREFLQQTLSAAGRP